MQASDRVLAQRYARAFFEATAGAKAEEKAKLELAGALKALKPHLSAFAHPLVSPADKKKLLKRLAGDNLSQTTTRFLEGLIRRKRIGLLPLIAQNFEKIFDVQRGLIRAQVRSALPLAAAQQEALKKTLEKFSGKTVQLEVREAPELLGGLVVKMGDWVLDRSLVSALNEMKERLAA